MTKMNYTIAGTEAQIVEQIAAYHIRRMVSHIKETFASDFKFDLQVTLSTSAGRNRSWGGERNGKPFISLALRKYIGNVKLNSKRTFKEYASFANHPTIGSLINQPWQLCIAALVAHELAHAVQHTCTTDVVRKVLGWHVQHETNHGEYFRAIYAHLRIMFVNGRDVDQTYTIVESKLPPQSAKRAEPKREKKTGVKMDIVKTGKGWFIHTYTDAATGVLLGKMASKPGFASQGHKDGKWETLIDPATGGYFKNHPAARKFFIGK